MTLYLKATSSRSAPRLFQVRGLCSTLGEDEAGLLTVSSANDPLFSIYCADNRFILVPHARDILLNGEVLETDVAAPLEDGTRFSLHDREFQSLITSALSEALARTTVTLAEISRPDLKLESLPLVSFSLAGTGKSYPLFPDVRYVAGNSPRSAIHLPLEGIAPCHCDFQYSGGSVSIRSLEGKITLRGREPDTACQVTEDCAVTL